MAALVLGSAAMSATSYKIFDIAEPGTWTGDGNGYTTTVKVGGKSFTIKTDKDKSANNLLSPVDNNKSWKVYMGSSFTIESSDVDMKEIVITYDTYEYQGKGYISELVLSTGWKGTLKDNIYTLVSDGLKNITLNAEKQQVRIVSVVVSDEVNAGGDTPVTPDEPNNVIYSNTFEENLDGWNLINDESLSDFKGWKINTKPACAICNSYYKDQGATEGTNHPANAKMEREFDLTNWKDVQLSIAQAFGFDFPTAQVANYRLYIKNGENTDYPAFANFPAAPAEGKNWTASFADNEFDLSEYDGKTITIGFEYATDGSKSRAWELKNFKLTGTNKSAVSNVEVEENVAPVYYNMQGVRVANPENGLYIVVKGNKATKVIF